MFFNVFYSHIDVFYNYDFNYNLTVTLQELNILSRKTCRRRRNIAENKRV